MLLFLVTIVCTQHSFLPVIVSCTAEAVKCKDAFLDALADEIVRIIGFHKQLSMPKLQRHFRRLCQNVIVVSCVTESCGKVWFLHTFGTGGRSNRPGHQCTVRNLRNWRNRCHGADSTEVIWFACVMQWVLQPQVCGGGFSICHSPDPVGRGKVLSVVVSV